MIRSIFCACLLQLLVSSAHAQSSKPARPNILVLLADDLGWGDIGIHRGAARTPNIDRLADEGTELTRYYTYPFCSPSRAAILTGQMPRRFGIISALQPRDAGLPAGLATLPRTLQKAGYQTMLVGKWHLGHGSSPHEVGFDHFYGFLGAEIDYFQHTNRVGQVDWQRNGEVLREDGYSTFLLADEAIRLLDQRDSNRPFYLQVAFNAPHFPFAVPPEFLSQYSHLSPTAAVRVAMIDALDSEIGRILETLDGHGLRRNTLVVFLSDNGADRSGRNVPFRGAKGSVYEGGIHVPCLMRWPPELGAGAVCSYPVAAQDLYPTLAAAVGVKLTDTPKIDGRNLWPTIQSGIAPESSPLLISAANTALFEGDWKLIEFANGQMSLFRISDDPEETTDLIGSQPDIVQRLQKTLSTQRKDLPALQIPDRPRRAR